MTRPAEHSARAELRRLLSKAISDPGAITPRGDNYEEPLVAWQVRAVSDALGLSLQERTHWTLYNPRSQAHRMSFIRGQDDVWTIEQARERMAPYHHEGDGYEVVERTQVWWQTCTRMTTELPVQPDDELIREAQR